MGTHASAEIFYGVAWPSEELPEKWAKEQQARWDADNYDGDDDDVSERLEDLLKELGLEALLEVDSHGNLTSEYGGYAVYVKGTGTHVGCGEVERLPMTQEVEPAAIAAIVALVDHLGAENATVGWLVTVTYG